MGQTVAGLAHGIKNIVIALEGGGFTCSIQNRVIHYEIIDNCCGMDAETRKKVFNKFFTTKGLQGTGLGTLMARKIVQEHGGNIDITSDLGTGTTVRIKLPRRRPPRIKKK